MLVQEILEDTDLVQDHLISWLAWKDKTLTWENLKKRDLNGLGQCVLCRNVA